MSLASVYEVLGLSALGLAAILGVLLVALQ